MPPGQGSLLADGVYLPFWVLVVAKLAVDSSKALYVRVLLARGRDSFHTLGPKTANTRNIWTWTSLGHVTGLPLGRSSVG